MRNVAKRLRFPLLGVGKSQSYEDTTYPTETGKYATPMAMNVIGSCVFEGRDRGGSRPGLVALESQPTDEGDGRWLWPNGEPVLWPSGDNMTFGGFFEKKTIPGGANIILPHETFSVRVSKGAVPSECSAMTFYRARLVVAKDAMWYASRSGSFDDFDYGGDGDDIGRASSGNVALSGRRGEDITALIAVNDSAMFVCTSRAIEMIQGEPTNGVVRRISHEVGVVSRDAWCFDSQRVWFLGPNGIYAMIPGESPLNASEQLPEDLKGIGSAVLVYDPENVAIHIFAGSRGDWYYDISNKAFWPLSYAVQSRPVAGGLAIVGGVNKPVFACADGVWRMWDDNDSKDETDPVESMVAIGPFHCGSRNDVDGILDTVTAVTADGSVDVTMSVYTAHSAEKAVKLAADGAATTTFLVHEGWNAVIRTRLRGSWCVIVLEASGKWAYESVLATIKVLGRLRP